MESQARNRLAGEKSPYLLQHAGNPVDWYPWGKEAFERARREDKPIFLSIGYSTCHWCHVMERESFEDASVAGLLNRLFITIKVDREERPDIDHTYMTVCQMMTGGGGWPLTIIMTPEKKPFFAATYIPKDDRYGRMGLLNLLPRVDDMWKKQRADLERSSNTVIETLQRLNTIEPGGHIDRAILDETAASLMQRFDRTHGGFGQAPKFPTPHNLLFLLGIWKRTGNEELLTAVETTLLNMRRGGIYDHVGFGFHRYSTDSQWHLPHFEKMLYDQALHLLAYTAAHQATGRGEYRRTAEEIIDYVVRDLTDSGGGFYSAEDADSEGEEGKYYLWDLTELNQVLSTEEVALVSTLFGFSTGGNFVEEASQSSTGKNLFHLVTSFEREAEKRGVDPGELEAQWNRIRLRLFKHRQQRIRPQRDDKILTDWNGLMIAGLAHAGRVFGHTAYLELAAASARFILDSVSGDDGRLLHRYRDGEAGLPAHVDDYAFFIWGLIELYEATFDLEYLEQALRLTRIFIDHYWDDNNGGFFFTADDAEDLPVRSKELYDGALPSGNSVALLNLIRLARMTSDSSLEERAARISTAFSGAIIQNPVGHTNILRALDFLLGPSSEVVIVAGEKREGLREMTGTLNASFLPHAVMLMKCGENSEKLARLAPFTRTLTADGGRTTAYLCRNFACDLPTTDSRELRERLVE